MVGWMVKLKRNIQFFSAGQYLIYNWKWGVSTNTSLEITNDGGVATIDGSTLDIYLSIYLSIYLFFYLSSKVTIHSISLC